MSRNRPAQRARRGSSEQDFEEIVADLPELVITYPEGVDIPAIRDWLGVNRYRARQVIACAQRCDYIDVIHRPRGGKYPLYIWPKGAIPAWTKLPKPAADLLLVIEQVAGARQSYPVLEISYSELSAAAGMDENKVRAALKVLIQTQAVVRERKASGHQPAVYRLFRSAVKTVNPKRPRPINQGEEEE